MQALAFYKYIALTRHAGSEYTPELCNGDAFSPEITRVKQGARGGLGGKRRVVLLDSCLSQESTIKRKTFRGTQWRQILRQPKRRGQAHLWPKLVPSTARGVGGTDFEARMVSA